MRLSQGEVEGITRAFSGFAMKGCSLYLYGSRTDDSLKGGDVDLHFEVPQHKLSDAKDQYLDFLVEMKRNIGDQKIDLLISSPEINDDDFLNQIRQKQILIKSW